MGPFSVFSACVVLETDVQGWWEDTAFFSPCPRRKTFLYAEIQLVE